MNERVRRRSAIEIRSSSPSAQTRTRPSLPTDATMIGHALLAALTALALLEHWFMVLPLPDQKLWRWMLPASPDAADPTPSPRK